MAYLWRRGLNPRVHVADATADQCQGQGEQARARRHAQLGPPRQQPGHPQPGQRTIRIYRIEGLKDTGAYGGLS